MWPLPATIINLHKTPDSLRRTPFASTYFLARKPTQQRYSIDSPIWFDDNYARLGSPLSLRPTSAAMSKWKAEAHALTMASSKLTIATVTPHYGKDPLPVIGNAETTYEELII